MSLLKRSGNKITIKKVVGQSPANIRHVDEKQGKNSRHIHIKVPKSILKKILNK